MPAVLDGWGSNTSPKEIVNQGPGRSRIRKGYIRLWKSLGLLPGVRVGVEPGLSWPALTAGAVGLWAFPAAPRDSGRLGFFPTFRDVDRRRGFARQSSWPRSRCS